MLFESPAAHIKRREQSMTERVFEGLTYRPDEDVMIDGPTGRALSAQTLMDNVKRLAGGLKENGFAKGQVLALMAPNMPEFSVVLHAGVWAGGTVTTINPAYTANEVRHQLIDSGAQILFVPQSLLEMVTQVVPDTSVTRIVVIDGQDPDTSMAGMMGAPLKTQEPVDYDLDVALLPYSSGTTGLPKGVMLSHRALVANIDQMLEMDIVRPGEVTICFLPFFHIYGLHVGLNAYLAGGGRMVTLPRFDLEVYLRLNQEHKTQAMWVVPPVALALAKHPMIDQFDLSSVAAVYSAAAPLGEDLGELVATRLNCTITQAYGMTEACPAICINGRIKARKGSVGPLVPSTQGRIVDNETGKDLGAGQDGEIWFKGPQTMMGYFNNPRATSETLTSDGWLRTGDIGHFDGDGYLFISDRLKELIKYKGFQVAPAEIEAELVTHPSIADAAVIGQADEEAGEVPVAFVVLTADQTLSEGAIITYLSGRLAHYKQVRKVTFVDAIPKSASGKILRRFLRDTQPE